MGTWVTSTAQLVCNQGNIPATLTVLRPNVLVEGKPGAVVTDSQPMVNVPSFGLCQSSANPAVQLATALAGGVKTPAPCVPAPAGPWTPGCPTVIVQGQPALDNTSTLMCAWAGVIQVVSPGQVKVQLP